MINFFLMDANLVFGVTCVLILMISALEILGLLLGFSLMGLMDDFLPADGAVEISDGGLSTLLGWLYLGKLPFLIWFMLFLTSFTILGYSSNFVALKLFSQPLSGFVIYPLVLILSLSITRYMSQTLAKILPKNESSAVSAHSFSGQLAQITMGRATVGSPSEAVLQDQYQKKHYIMVAPNSNKDTFSTGDKVVLLEKHPGFWTAIPFDN